MFLDWFRARLRHGWLGTLRARTSDHEPVTVSAGNRLYAVQGARKQYQLALPYGPRAVELGLGFRDPPRRPSLKSALAHQRAALMRRHAATN